MHLYNTIDVTRAVRKIFGDAACKNITFVVKSRDVFKVYVDDLSSLDPESVPDGVTVTRERLGPKEYYVIVFERRDIDV